ncbi:hypothetical protein EHQ47_16865 [Leptospira bourretii]|uniref:hypothetical protein n=1 Tax=Leptospira bourretii TaxID=2484962 RepID=UPI001090CA60|nr:hypothetical protein [Leptospira bourretii]TGL19768.1 hypothetical protein EHQ47_16865 [Leptospira bourretii]
MKYKKFLKSSTDENKIYTYPFQIGLQTLEIVNANLFYIIFTDTAASLQVKKENGIQEIYNKMKLDGASDKNIEKGMEYFKEYEIILKSSVYMRFLTEMVAQWEFYLSEMQKFMQLNINLINPEILNNTLKKQFDRLTKLEILKQIDTITIIVDNKLKINESDKELLSEMFLLRNLGQHNRWECDEKYLHLSKQGKKWELGHLRMIKQEEVTEMYRAFSSTIRTITEALSLKFEKGQHNLD